MLSIPSFNLTTNEDLHSATSQFLNGSVYVTHNSLTYSYRKNQELGVVVKTPAKRKLRKLATIRQKVSRSGSRVRWSEVRKRCLSFLALKLSQRYSVFVTITFPSGTTDANCRKYLNTWLTRMRSFRKSFPYLWVAERQKNKTLHFHLLTNQYIPVKLANGLMAKIIQGKKGESDVVPRQPPKSQYNGLDIKAIRSRGMMIKYLVKYMSKAKEVITGSAWHCSRLFSKLATSVTVHPVDVYHWLKRVAIDTPVPSQTFKVLADPDRVTVLLPISPPRSWLNNLFSYNDQLSLSF